MEEGDELYQERRREGGRESLNGMGHKQAAILRQGELERERRAGEQGRRGRKAPSRRAGDGRKIARREHAHMTSGQEEGGSKEHTSDMKPSTHRQPTKEGGQSNQSADIISGCSQRRWEAGNCILATWHFLGRWRTDCMLCRTTSQGGTHGWFRRLQGRESRFPKAEDASQE